ncbi:hypothetical protein DEI99_002620 [Curtobacterium sp. MCLR17_036]|uniref:hypothetical protein n=1 Tax=Curtobacterium sp. MCLR17_036 TaxID=2175620 RepID=UPI000DA89428|nr:hypothetical protein [Curtobacterium sp. MCLR17_036]WIE65446.1 hypothetical protein DEI99_002620 [Curtobacterium sp. MCLR17_036]
MVLVVLVASSCAAPPVRPDRSPSGADASLRHAGPWADEFRSALDHGVSDSEASMLSDGKVTAAELEEAHEGVRRCLADSGLGIEYDPDGGFSLQALNGKYPDDYFERSDPVLRACEERYDEYVTYLFEQTRRNPERLDEAEITVPCLQRAGLVDRGYTEEQWRKDYDDDTLPFDWMDEKARQCELDPLGLWRDG